MDNTQDMISKGRKADYKTPRKLSPENAQSIRESHRVNQVPIKELAATYNVSPALIRAVLDGRAYGDV